MKKLKTAVIASIAVSLLLSAGIPGAGYAQDGAAQTQVPGIGQGVLDLQEAFVRIADQVKPAVVNISTVYVEKGQPPQEYEFFFGSPFEDFFSEFFGEQQNRNRRVQPKGPGRKHEGTGSGVIIDPDGYILTNEHVVRGASEIKVTLNNDKKYTGRIVGKDARTDLAVIKIKAGQKLPFAKLGDSEQARVGEWAVAIGSPFGLEETVTFGNISAVRQSLTIEGKEYRDLIQTDAAINRGNSGGPLCNIRGEVIGINTAIYAPTGVFSGIGFAIPVNSARLIMTDLIEKGRVVRGWLGVEIKGIDVVIARQFGLPDIKGVLVNDVIKDSPAAAAGLLRGDVIREFNGKTVEDARGLQSVVSQAQPKQKISLKIIRDQKELSVPLVIGEMPSEEELVAREESGKPAAGSEASAEWEGMSVATLTDQLAQEYLIPSGEEGCVVTGVKAGSAAADMGVLPGDLIRAMNRRKTPTARDFRSAAEKIKISDGVMLDINRRGRLIYLSYSGQ